MTINTVYISRENLTLERSFGQRKNVVADAANAVAMYSGSRIQNTGRSPVKICLVVPPPIDVMNPTSKHPNRSIPRDPAVMVPACAYIAVRTCS